MKKLEKTIVEENNKFDLNISKKEIIKEYNLISEQLGYFPPREELAKNYRGLYNNLKFYENAKNQSFLNIPKRNKIQYKKKDFRINKVLGEINDTEKNLSKAYNQFIKDYTLKELLEFKEPGSYKKYLIERAICNCSKWDSTLNKF